MSGPQTKFTDAEIDEHVENAHFWKDGITGKFFRNEVRRVLRACPDCGFNRKVKITVQIIKGEGEKILIDATHTRCGVCHAEARARYYARESLRWKEKAAELRVRRAQGQQRRMAPKRTS